MGKEINKRELAEITGYSERALTDMQEEGLPIEKKGSRGEENEYDSQRVIEWLINRALLKAGKAESQRDREARLRGDMLEIELAKERAILVPVDQVAPVWENRVLVAAAAMLGRASRLASILEATPGIEEKRAVLKKEDAEFLTKLGTHGEQMQADLDALLAQCATGEAEAFLKRLASYGTNERNAQGRAPGGLGKDDPAGKDPPV